MRSTKAIHDLLDVRRALETLDGDVVLTARIQSETPVHVFELLQHAALVFRAIEPGQLCEDRRTADAGRPPSL